MNNETTTGNSVPNLTDMETLGQYLKSSPNAIKGRDRPPLENWHPKQVDDMDLVIKSNGEWWHEGTKMTRESLVSLFATVLWVEEKEGIAKYYLKTPVQLLRIQVEDAPLFINDVGIVAEDDINWLEFTTTTGDVVRLGDDHLIALRHYQSPEIKSEGSNKSVTAAQLMDGKNVNVSQVRPYMNVRHGLHALIGRNTFYHLINIGELIEREGQTILTLLSGGKRYEISMPNLEF